MKREAHHADIFRWQKFFAFFAKEWDSERLREGTERDWRGTEERPKRG